MRERKMADGKCARCRDYHHCRACVCCADVVRVIEADDALRHTIFGDRASVGGYALAWCARERAYHYKSERATDRILNGTVAARNRSHTSGSVSGGVRVVANGSAAFVARYERGRTYARAPRYSVRERATMIDALAP